MNRTGTDRFLVFGAGAIGSVVGGFLRRAGHEVVLLGRRPHLDVIAADGLRIDGIWGRHRVRGFHGATTVEEAAAGPPPDWVLVTVKSCDTATAARAIAGFADAWPRIRIVSMQNGLGNVETLAAVVGRVPLAARVITGAEVTAPGRVRVTVTADAVRIGMPGGGLSADARRLARLLAAAGIPAAGTSRIERYLWSKVVYNCALNAPATLLNCVYGDLLKTGETRELMRRIVDEVYAVAAGERVAMSPPTARGYLRRLFADLIPRTAEHRPSMLQDVRRGRRTEIDALNGAVARRGAALRIPTPTNDTLALLIRARESPARNLPEEAG